jgi:hypothetical protein
MPCQLLLDCIIWAMTRKNKKVSTCSGQTQFFFFKPMDGEPMVTERQVCIWSDYGLIRKVLGGWGYSSPHLPSKPSTQAFHLQHCKK